MADNPNHRDRCATCGEDVVYVTTSNMGLWGHAQRVTTTHPAEPIRQLTAEALVHQRDEAWQQVLAATQSLPVHGFKNADPDAVAAAEAAQARFNMLEHERQNRVRLAMRSAP